ncbi:MAG: hypothetical protein ACI970_001676 [Myxococcota bacterium]|jgi:hypothetical protein
MVLEAVPDRPDLIVRLHVDDNVMTIISTRITLQVRYGDSSVPANVVLQTSYEALLDLAEGLMAPDEFAAHHVEIIEGPHHAGAFFELMGAAIALQP